MAVNNGDIKEERDFNLVCSLADRARGLLRDYSSWVEDEIRDCQIKIEALEATVGDEGITGELKTALEVMEHMLRFQLPNAKTNLRDKCKEIEDGAFDSIIDAQQWLQDGIGRFETIAWRMTLIRKLVNDNWKE
jgi:hypothetical protein